MIVCELILLLYLFFIRFILKAPPAAPRRDRNLDNVIISEVRDRTIAKHQVSELELLTATSLLK